MSVGDALVEEIVERVAERVRELLPPSVPQSPWMDLERAAAHYAIRVGTFRQLVQQGKIPGHRAGKRWIFHRDEVDAALGYARASNVTTLRRAS